MITNSCEKSCSYSYFQSVDVKIYLATILIYAINICYYERFTRHFQRAKYIDTIHYIHRLCALEQRIACGPTGCVPSCMFVIRHRSFEVALGGHVPWPGRKWMTDNGAVDWHRRQHERTEYQGGDVIRWPRPISIEDDEIDTEYACCTRIDNIWTQWTGLNLEHITSEVNCAYEIFLVSNNCMPSNQTRREILTSGNYTRIYEPT